MVPQPARLVSRWSDGYRTVTALVLDLLRQLIRAYGGLELVADAAGIQFAHEGVVLIDEMDLHLHVSWQKRIGFWLREHFPHLQFIVTTHSPFICQAADEGGLVRLPAPCERDGARIIEGELFNRIVNGTVDNAVLTDLFGLDTTYSVRATALRNEVASLETRAARDSISAAELQRLQDLRAQLPRTPSSDVADALRQRGWATRCVIAMGALIAAYAQERHGENQVYAHRILEALRRHPFQSVRLPLMSAYRRGEPLDLPLEVRRALAQFPELLR